MRTLEHGLTAADVVAAFEDQADAERAVAELRRAGFRDDHLGYFAWHPLEGMKNLIDRTYAPDGALVGMILGAVFGVWAAPVIGDQFVAVRSVLGFFELAALSVVGAAFLFAALGWEVGVRLHERGTSPPAVDPEAGPFVVTVAAAEDTDWVWLVLRRHRGYEPQRAHAPQPHAI
jgi:hypothetical protein